MAILSGGKVTIGGTATINNNTNLSSHTYPENITVNAGGTFTDSRSNFTITNTPYRLLNAFNDNYNLDVSGARVANDTNVQIWGKNTSSTQNAQKWYICLRKIMDGKVYYGLASALGGGQYLWVAGNSSTSGADVITYQVHGNNGGFWSAENAGSVYMQQVTHQALM